MLRYLVIFGCLCFSLNGWAQQPLSNKRVKRTVLADTLVLDSLPIIPESVAGRVVNGQSINTDSFQIKDNCIIWIGDASSLSDSIEITYRILSIDLKKPVAHLDTNLIRKEYQSDYIGFEFGTIENKPTTSNWLNNKGLQYSGSFARGISFGNSQDLVLNSSFNLQIAGKIGEDTEIVAALTDENIPLQADGNTQQLNEFDRIYIQIKRPNTSLTMGDYELASPDGYFSKYFKKLQGATFQWSSDGISAPSPFGSQPIKSFSAKEENQFFKNKTEENDTKRAYTQASVAIARGQFARNFITPQEGNQGPYRLEGNQNEPFIIVLSGTEKVYIDGQLMIRGIEEDYIIDYNRGELTFMNRRLITKDHRIIVEFEYIDQTFQRSLYAWNSAYETDKLKIYANIFSQQDSRNASGNLDLTEDQRLQLQNAGDNLQNAITSSIRPIEEAFNPARIQYLFRDTTYQLLDTLTDELQTISTTILVFATASSDNLVSATFSNVGMGNGNYILSNASGANGRVYEWVAPAISGQLQGDFEPVQQLTAPEQQQLFALGAEYQINKNSSLQIETSLSNNDLNRLSDKNNEDNVGTALFANYQLHRSIGKKDWELKSQFKYEYVQKDFRALNPYRDPEFNRDWNLNFANLEQLNEHIGKGGLRLNKADKVVIDYGFSGFFRGDVYEGIKQDFFTGYKDNGYDFRVYGSLLNTETATEKGQFFRPRIDLSKSFAKWKDLRLGVYGERERNERRTVATDTLSATSFYWDIYKVYLEKPDAGKFQWHIHFQKRYDFAPTGVAFLNNTTADEININGSWQYQRGGQLGWNFSYRNLTINQPELSNQQARTTYLGRLDYSLQAWRGAVRFHTNYEVASGQEARTEFQFVRVNAGEGFFVWNPTEEFDLNGDSIPQINEFVIAPFRDQANYIRINTFTNDFIRTNNVILNQSLQLTPRAIWSQQNGWKKVMSHFSTLSTLRILRKVNASNNVSAWNPFDLAIADTALVSISANIRNVLYFNQHHPIYDIQLGHFDNRSRSLLTTGFENQKNAEQFLRNRWTLNSHLNSTLNLIIGNRVRASELFANRAFDIDYQIVRPEITYLPNPQWETAFTYEFQKAQNQLPEAKADATFHDLKASLQYNRTQKIAFRTELSFVNIDLKGDINPTLQLALLEGLQDGQNFLWNMTIDRQVANNVQLRIGYEGRKTGNRQVVHLGSMQLRATF